jgi:uncharacterized protein YggE
LEEEEHTMRIAIAVVLLTLGLGALGNAQSPELKFIADTLVVQADGTYEADPDLATMTFHVFSQEKELKKATTLRRSPWDESRRSPRIMG